MSAVVDKLASELNADERIRVVASLAATAERAGLDREEAVQVAEAVLDVAARGGWPVRLLDGYDCAPEGSA